MQLVLNRTLDREFVTRFIAFFLQNYNDYIPDLDTFMNKTMGELKKTNEQKRGKIKRDFDSSMHLARSIFGDWAFRKTDKYPDKKKPINKALFEVWSVLLAKLNDDERNKLMTQKENLFAKSVSLVKNDKVFFDSITTATGNKANVAERFSKINKIIQEVLEQ